MMPKDSLNNSHGNKYPNWIAQMCLNCLFSLLLHFSLSLSLYMYHKSRVFPIHTYLFAILLNPASKSSQSYITIHKLVYKRMKANELTTTVQLKWCIKRSDDSEYKHFIFYNEIETNLELSDCNTKEQSESSCNGMRTSAPVAVQHYWMEFWLTSAIISISLLFWFNIS